MNKFARILPAAGVILFLVSATAGVYDVNPIPEPATMLLFGSGLIGIAFLGRKRFSKK
jgi:hypothetical protein